MLCGQALLDCDLEFFNTRSQRFGIFLKHTHRRRSIALVATMDVGKRRDSNQLGIEAFGHRIDVRWTLRRGQAVY